MRQPKTFQTPLLGLLLATTILAKASQAKPYLLGYGQSPWIPLKPFQNYVSSNSPLWQPLAGNFQYNQLTTSSPQIQPPPLNQQQIIHIHETPPLKNPADDNIEAIQDHSHQSINTKHKIDQSGDSEIPLFEESNPHTVKYTLDPSITTETEFQNVESEEIENDIDSEYDSKADSSNLNYSILNSTDLENITLRNGTFLNPNGTEKDGNNISGILTTIPPKELESSAIENNDGMITNKRSRRTTPRPRRPIHDYIESRNGNRRRPTRRRTTTPSYDYNIFEKQANRRRKRPSTKPKPRPNRRPINKEPEFYDSEYDEDEYDDYYPSSVNVFARQEDTTTAESTTTETTSGTTTTQTTAATKTSSTLPNNNTYGYTYGPPVQSAYGPPGQTGYGPSNGNEYISITYPPVSGPSRDALAPLLDSLYSQYSKNSIIKRLQELLQPNNFYNNQQYDMNYPENF